MRHQSWPVALIGFIIGLAFIWHLSGASPAVSAADFPEPLKIIQSEGQFVFTDGSSYYLLKKDGTFKSGPLGLSGREITGTWKAKDSLFVIEGQWGWVNGLSALNDYRRMTIFVSTPTSVETVKRMSWVEASADVKVYKCYFIVDELQKLPRPQSAR
jgi:hypothetical protein